MPTYDYECDACGHRYEMFQSIMAGPTRKCPACGKRKVRRLIGAGGAILFKGSGFYTTDYRSADYRKQASAENSAASPKSDEKKSSPDKKKSSAGGKKE